MQALQRMQRGRTEVVSIANVITVLQICFQAR